MWKCRRVWTVLAASLVFVACPAGAKISYRSDGIADLKSHKGMKLMDRLARRKVLNGKVANDTPAVGRAPSLFGAEPDRPLPAASDSSHLAEVRAKMMNKAVDYDLLELRQAKSSPQVNPGFGKGLVRDRRMDLQKEEQVLRIHYFKGGITSLENTMRHAPGIYGFAGMCELDAARDHCSQNPAPTDQFCESGVLDKCYQLADQCSGFEHAPPCKVTEDPCCLCSFQICPLNADGCKRIDKQCYHLSATAKAVAARQKMIRSSGYLGTSDLERINEMVDVFDLDKNGWLQYMEMKVLVRLATGPDSLAHFSHGDYVKLCSELGADEVEGISQQVAYKAFQRRRGQFYNLLLSIPLTPESELDASLEIGIVKHNRAKEILEYEMSLAKALFEQVDVDSNAFTSLSELAPLLELWFPHMQDDSEFEEWLASVVESVDGGSTTRLSEFEFFLSYYLEAPNRDLPADGRKLKSQISKRRLFHQGKRRRIIQPEDASPPRGNRTIMGFIAWGALVFAGLYWFVNQFADFGVKKTL